MSRYSKISRGIHDSPDYLALSAPAPNAQSCWVYLLTCRELLPIPGVILAGKATLAEGLRWPVEGFAKAFGEVSAKGMAEADWNARVVWIPNAWRHNLPESPNVIRSWGKSFANIPRTPLKQRIYEGIREMSEGLGEGFRKAFREAFGDPSPNQEQEQEQEQEQVRERASAPPPPRVQAMPWGDIGPPPVPMLGAELVPLEPKATKRRPTRRAPADWQPRLETLEALRAQGHSAQHIETCIAMVRDHEFRTPRTDWDATLRNWVRQQQSFGGGGSNDLNQRVPRGNPLLQRDPVTGPIYESEDF